MFPLGLGASFLLLQVENRSAEVRIGEAKALFFPQINLTSFVGMTAVGGPFGATSAVAEAAGSLFQFIFDGGRRKGNYEAAKDDRFS